MHFCSQMMKAPHGPITVARCVLPWHQGSQGNGAKKACCGVQAVPVVGNRGGSLLTMFSVGGLEFGFIFLSTCFGWVWADQGFWQSAIAARPEAAYK